MQLRPNGTKGHSLTTWITPLGPLPHRACWRTTGILTYSMEQNPSWEANRFSVKKFPAFYVTRRFITAFTRAPNCPYPEPDRSSPFPHTPFTFLKIHLNIIFSSTSDYTHKPVELFLLFLFLYVGTHRAVRIKMAKLRRSFLAASREQMRRCIGRSVTVRNAETEQFALIYVPLSFAAFVLNRHCWRRLSGEKSRDTASTTSQNRDCCAADLDCRSKCLSILFGGGGSEGVSCGAQKVSLPICTARCIAGRQAI